MAGNPRPSGWCLAGSDHTRRAIASNGAVTLAVGWDELQVDHAGEGLFVSATSPSYKGHWYPVEVISLCVWLYFRFPAQLPRGRGADAGPRRGGLLRDGPPVVSEVRPGYANSLRRRRPRPGDKWYLGEVFLKSTVRSTCGGPSTPTATSSTSSCRPVVTRLRPAFLQPADQEDRVGAPGDRHGQAPFLAVPPTERQRPRWSIAPPRD